MKKKWDAKKKSEIERKSRDLVWVDATHYSMDQPSRKLSTKQLGPFVKTLNLTVEYTFQLEAYI